MEKKNKDAEDGDQQNKLLHKRRSPKEYEVSDGGVKGWVVCFASFWTNGSIFGIINTFGILYIRFLDEYAQDGKDLAFKTSWIGSLNIGLTFISSPLAAILVDQLGIRKTAILGAIMSTVGMLASSFISKLELLYLTYGVLMGMGNSFVYNPSMVILGHYFKKRLGLANGIVTFGSAVFTIVMPYILNACLGSVGLHHTLRILSGIYATLILCALVWKPTIHTNQNQELHKSSFLSTQSIQQAATGCKRACQKVCNINVWKVRGYVIWVLAVPTALFGYFIPFVHLVKHVKDIMPEENGATLVTCIGITTGIGRLVFGKVADFPSINRIRMQQIAFVIFGIATCCIPLARHFEALIVITCVLGLCDGCFICLLGPIAIDLLGPVGASQGFGFMLGSIAIPLTIGPPVAGLVYDYLGTYDLAFYAAGAPPILGAILMFLVPYKKHYIGDHTADQLNESLEDRVVVTIKTDPDNQLKNGSPIKITNLPAVEETYGITSYSSQNYIHRHGLLAAEGYGSHVSVSKLSASVA